MTARSRNLLAWGTTLLLLASLAACKKTAQGTSSSGSSAGGGGHAGSGSSGSAGSASGTSGSSSGRGTTPLCHPCLAHSDCLSGYCNYHEGTAAPFCDTADDCTAEACAPAACRPDGACDCHPEQYFSELVPDGGGGGGGGSARGCDGCLSDADCLNGGHCQIISVVGICVGATCASDSDCSWGHVCRGGVCDCSAGSSSSSGGTSGSSSSSGGGVLADCAPCAQSSDCQSGFCNTYSDPAHPYCDESCDPGVDAGPALCGGYGCSTLFCACPGHGGTSSSTGSTGSGSTSSTGGSTSGGASSSTGGTSSGGPVPLCGTCTQDSDCQAGTCQLGVDQDRGFCDVGCFQDADCGGNACTAYGICACPLPDGGPRAAPCQPCASGADCASWFCNTVTNPGHPYCDSTCSGSECGSVGCNAQGNCACP